ncbi:MAG: hypothetical protein EXR80_05430 [Methylococcales bacterium]|nr:hypothetical protein [Methylococcales bacterium]
MTSKKVASLVKQPDAVVVETIESTTTVPNSPKRGKHLISGLYEPAAYRQFGVLAAELGLDKRELLREALNDLFIKHKKPPIA